MSRSSRQPTGPLVVTTRAGARAAAAEAADSAATSNATSAALVSVASTLNPGAFAAASFVITKPTFVNSLTMGMHGATIGGASTETNTMQLDGEQMLNEPEEDSASLNSRFTTDSSSSHPASSSSSASAIAIVGTTTTTPSVTATSTTETEANIVSFPNNGLNLSDGSAVSLFSATHQAKNIKSMESLAGIGMKRSRPTSVGSTEINGKVAETLEEQTSSGLARKGVVMEPGARSKFISFANGVPTTGQALNFPGKDFGVSVPSSIPEVPPDATLKTLPRDLPSSYLPLGVALSPNNASGMQLSSHSSSRNSPNLVPLNTSLDNQQHQNGDAAATFALGEGNNMHLMMKSSVTPTNRPTSNIMLLGVGTNSPRMVTASRSTIPSRLGNVTPPISPMTAMFQTTTSVKLPLRQRPAESVGGTPKATMLQPFGDASVSPAHTRSSTPSVAPISKLHTKQLPLNASSVSPPLRVHVESDVSGSSMSKSGAAAAREAAALSSSREIEYAGAQYAAIVRMDIERAKAIHEQLNRAAAIIDGGNSGTSIVPSGTLKGKTPTSGPLPVPISTATTRSPLLVALSGGNPSIAATLIGLPAVKSVSSPANLSTASSAPDSTKGTVRTLASSNSSAQPNEQMAGGFLVRKLPAQQRTAIDILSGSQNSSAIGGPLPTVTSSSSSPLLTPNVLITSSGVHHSNSNTDVLDPFPLTFKTNHDSIADSKVTHAPGVSLADLMQMTGLDAPSDVSATYSRVTNSPQLKALGTSAASEVVAKAMHSSTVRAGPLLTPGSNPKPAPNSPLKVDSQKSEAPALDAAIAVALAIHDSPLFSSKAASEFAAVVSTVSSRSSMNLANTSVIQSSATSASNSPALAAARAGAFLSNRGVPSLGRTNFSGTLFGGNNSLVVPKAIHQQNQLYCGQSKNKDAQVSDILHSKILVKSCVPEKANSTKPYIANSIALKSTQEAPLSFYERQVIEDQSRSSQSVQKIDIDSIMKGGLKGGMMSRKQFLLAGSKTQQDKGDEKKNEDMNNIEADVQLLQAARKRYLIATQHNPHYPADEAAEPGYDAEHYDLLTKHIQNSNNVALKHCTDEDLLEDEELRELMSQINPNEFISHLNVIDRVMCSDDDYDEDEDEEVNDEDMARVEEAAEYYIPSDSGTSDGYYDEDQCEDDNSAMTEETFASHANPNELIVNLQQKLSRQQKQQHERGRAGKQTWLSYERHKARLNDGVSSRIGDQYQAVIPDLNPPLQNAEDDMKAEKINITQEAQGAKRGSLSVSSNFSRVPANPNIRRTDINNVLDVVSINESTKQRMRMIPHEKEHAFTDQDESNQRSTSDFDAFDNEMQQAIDDLSQAAQLLDSDSEEEMQQAIPKHEIKKRVRM